MSKLKHEHVLSILYWYCLTSKKILKLLPWHTFKIVILSLVAQVATLLAALLPLKVVLLLGSTRTPHYFPEVLLDVDRSQLIVGLSIAAVCFFLLRMITEKLIDMNALKGSKFLLKKSRKIILYENQSDVAKNAYGDFLKSITGIIFFVLAFYIVNRIYPSLSVIVSSYIILSSLLVLVISSYNPSFRLRMEKKLMGVLRVVSLIGFFISFTFIVTDFIVPIAPPGLVSALLGLILTRQMLNVSIGSIQNISHLYNRRIQVDALFFHGHLKSHNLGKKEKEFWGLGEPLQRDAWITTVLSETLGLKIERIKAKWHHSGIKNTMNFEVETYNENQELKLFFIKLYSNKLSLKAMNDLALLQECNLSFVTPELLAATEVGRYHCHIFPLEESLIARPNVDSWHISFLKCLIVFQPPENFLERYCRSHPLLWQRLNITMLHRLRLVATDEQLKQLEMVEENFENILSELRSLPVRLFFSKLSPDTVTYTKDDKLKIISWGGWSFEPMGFGWPIENDGMTVLMDFLKDMNISDNSELVSSHTVVLSAVLSKFEELFSKQDFVRALTLLPIITSHIGCYDEG